MKLFLTFYFIFCIFSDSWIDGGRIAGVDGIANQSILNPVQGATNEAQLINFFQQKHESHKHSDCPEGCPDHVCHVGHCNFQLGSFDFTYLQTIGRIFFFNIDSYSSLFLGSLFRPPIS